MGTLEADTGSSPQGPIHTRIPEGDTRERKVCTDCGFIHYENPKIVAGAVVSHAGKILLCKRAIEPRSGYWTLPAGYLEQGETPAEGAKREAREEANADLVIDSLLGVYSVTRISQVQLIYRATLSGGRFSAGEETEDAQLFAWDDIPWDDIAFPTVIWALKDWLKVRGETDFPPFANPAGETAQL